MFRTANPAEEVHEQLAGLTALGRLGRRPTWPTWSRS